ncbi:MAG: lipid IV(A) 3-deoxy-D-manno-octulosonic acid transferase [Spongiibacter sp.]|nr:lipid IV(A) 3-deoxy-D-manno-octulosonic acid transferase [Spongiibacter sp.]
MARLLYSILFYLLLPLVLLRLAYRALKAPDYRHRVAERFGFFRSSPPPGGLWVHAVSVGETIAAAPLIRHYLQQHPDLPVTVTTMTPTGSERVRALFGNRVFHVYAPYDTPDSIHRFLRRIKPRAAVIMETEVWPNMVCQTAASGVPVVLANARLSAKSAAGYQRAGALSKPVMRAFYRIVAQHQADARRFAELGVEPHALRVSGSIKFDLTLEEAQRRSARELRQSLGSDRPVWIAASTHEGEDELLLAAHRKLLTQLPEALLILVPRHPERFDSVARLIENQAMSYLRRSASTGDTGSIQVLLGDTMGELLVLLGCADVAFIGGSLVPHGGHNSLEAAAWGLPILTGHSDFNFADISQRLEEAGALIKTDAQEIGAVLTSLLANQGKRESMGSAALAVMEGNRGALATLIAEIDAALASGAE